MARLWLGPADLLPAAIDADLHLAIVVATSTRLRLLLHVVHLNKLLLVREGVRAELLGLLPRSLLVGAHVPGQTLIRIHPLSSLLRRHMKDGRGLARVVDDNVVDIIVVYDVRDVAARALRRLNAVLLLWVPRWRTPAAHTEALAVGDPLAFEPALVLRLLRH